MSSIQVSHIVKNFKETQVLKDLSLRIPDGSFTVLLGPSGCGKSTLLRVISGLEKADSGEVYIGEREVSREEPGDRNVAMVFQNYALYPHMTASENVEYGLKIKKVPKEKRRQMVAEALEMVDLTDQAKKRPSQMSGGQRQRVALARAVVKNPQAFLMDEPLSNLDAKLRNQMREKITLLHNRLATTFLYVTHDQVEAMSMGSFIIILNQGKVMQQGTPQEIYTNPANVFVAGFIGSPPSNILTWNQGSIAVRPEHLLVGEPEHPGIHLQGRVQTVERLGSDSIFSLETSIGHLKAKTACSWESPAGLVDVCIPEDAIFFFDGSGERIYGPVPLPAFREYAAKASAERQSA